MHRVPNANRGRVKRLKALRMGVWGAGTSTNALRRSHTTAARIASAMARPTYVWAMTRLSTLRKVSSAAPESVFGSVLASDPKIKIDPTYGKIVVPKELNACAKVNRLLVVSGRPNMEIKGLATTCTVVIPEASTNKATRNNPNKPCDDAGTNSAQPAVMVRRPTTAERI